MPRLILALWYRYEIGRVYRRSFSGGRPKEVQECSIDVAWPLRDRGTIITCRLAFHLEAVHRHLLA